MSTQTFPSAGLDERSRGEILSSEALDFLPETEDVRQGDWRVVGPRADYADRRVQITGPTDRKMVIKALNSGAREFMADSEDAKSPTWHNQVSGHTNLIDAVDETISAPALLDAGSTPGTITEAGLRADISVGFQYITFWLGGRSAAGISNLMEAAATAEISRSQIWQWIRHGSRLEDRRVLTRGLVRTILAEEMDRIRADVGPETWIPGRPDETRAVFAQVALQADVPEFLTLVAYELLD